MRALIWLAICSSMVLCIAAEEQPQQQAVASAEVSDEAISSGEVDLSPSPATVQYRVRPFNYQPPQYHYQQQQQFRQQQQQHEQEPQQSQEVEEESGEEEENVPQQHQPIYRRPYQQEAPQQTQNHYQQQQQQSHPVMRKVEQNQKRLRPQNQGKQQFQQELEDELEDEEPDRLSLLLEQSSFQCNGRTGYYADEGLGCEVFHYCQEPNQKHSWICPEGFTFHQVHLICMPAGNDNVCEQSAKYHFVNDYLYKPINMEEHERKPNISLRYSERYFPEEIFQDERQDYDDDYEQPRHQPQYRQQVVQQRQQVNTAVRREPPPQHQYRPQQQQQATQSNNVFRSPEEINIPLSQRRPNYYQPTTARYDTSVEEPQEEEEAEY